ncbi:hypothetical protein FA13DRAFT_1726881 [Coprinellus micaceus]|uniref:ZZ-type domain-containing protein n=1 Tax=Coprinellus micaceus TaxID=71717 RepID=A0A4Y7TRI9_COPMI|nr:hypothetical protein FA13DRAFT_1726881 [Coprinellus micaceus]
MANRPDRPLVVKCRFGGARKKISFHSSKNCTYGELRRKIDQCFSLSAGAYIVSWRDDEGEIVPIDCEDDLTEAIVYFCSGDDTQSTSGASILSFGRGRVTLEVTITIDYDGPSLSDTSSLASLEEYRRDSNRRSDSFSLSSPSSLGEPDDDSITVSSRDHLGSSSSTHPQDRPHHSASSPRPGVTVSPTVHYTATNSSSVSSSYREGNGSHFSFHLSNDTPSTSASDINEPLSSALERFPPNPSAVFERLKISEALGEGQQDWGEYTGGEDRGTRWLREQVKRAGGVVDEFSSSDEEDLDCLSLERNPSGHYYYTYNTSAGSQVDGDKSLEPSEDAISFEEPTRLHKPRPTTMQLEWVAAQRIETEEHRRLQECASQSSLRSSKSNRPHGQDTSFDLKYYNLPAPPPEIVTGCSSCGEQLTLQRYICSTCGENEPTSQSKGKRKDTSHAFTYPPAPMPGSPSSASSGSGESLGTRIYQTLTQSPTFSGFASRAQLSPPVPQQDFDEPPSGFELCPDCLGSAGLVHAIEAGMGSPSSGQSAAGSSNTSLQLQQQDPTWKRSAPKRGHIRHSYIEKIWGEFGWEEISQDEHSVSKCSVCSTITEAQRYKCASCSNFNLCRGHYRVVHNCHPIHPFILVPDKPKFTQIGIEDLSGGEGDGDEEPSMEHSATCAHCLLPIVGALFHCAICESVDICSNCEAAGLPGNLDSEEGGHDSSHILLKIPYAMKQSTLQKASKAAMKRWHGRDAAVALSASHHSQPEADSGTVIGSKATSAHMESPLDHGIPCDSCHQRIIGTRYQCCQCPSYPSAYNLCTRCEARSWAVHDPMHIFFKLPTQVNHVIESRQPFFPPLYEVPAGPMPGRYPLNNDPREYLRELVHRSVLCDRCMNKIEGEWFHCACCPIDLCDQCESVDTHAPEHAFVVFKNWNDPEHPSPILDFSVY